MLLERRRTDSLADAKCLFQMKNLQQLPKLREMLKDTRTEVEQLHELNRVLSAQLENESAQVRSTNASEKDLCFCTFLHIVYNIYILARTYQHTYMEMRSSALHTAGIIYSS